jgi:hypothetical protein
MESKFIYLDCRISAGMFSSECVFELTLSSGEHYFGIAPRNYCRKPNGQPLAAGSPKNKESISGKIAARLIRNGGDVALVAIPDGEAVEVPAGIVSPRELETSHVPV